MLVVEFSLDLAPITGVEHRASVQFSEKSSLARFVGGRANRRTFFRIQNLADKRLVVAVLDFDTHKTFLAVFTN